MAHQPFDPNHFVSKVKGRDYLEVKWRIFWLRNEHPDASLTTDLVSHADGRAILRAHVTIPEGGSATGYGSETAQSFENYIEKAETKAIGRALTALGYGTPATDASVIDENKGRAQIQSIQSQSQSNAYMATPPQRSRIQRLASELHIDEAQLCSLVQQHTGSSLANVNKRQASGIIDLLESRRPVQQNAS